MAEGRNAPATALADERAAMEQQDRSQNLRDLAVVAASSKTFIAGAAILLFWMLVALFWGAVVPYSPQALDPTASLAPPSAEHWFGTDNLGRDVFSRVLAGASSVLTVAPLGTALGMLGGIAVGLVTGYYRGRVDDVVMRVVDALLAFPLIIIAVLVLSVLGPSKVNVILVIGVVFTPIVARTVRSAVLSEREREYVAAARLRGESGLYIMVSEILPNILSPIAVEATIRLGYAIFTSATLSFLSLGIQEPSPDWGLTISIGRVYLQAAPWMVLFPALALATLVVAVNLVADGLLQAVEE
ncbi:MAG: ABC transporter permease [Actinomycetota bacterium]|nr:ABC transporter permease [Actinomycetota bacterium]MDQ5828378.1 ABC transporter permease [Actinomycetota bacterium]